MIIGVDPHKSSHTATAVTPATNTATGSLRVEASRAGCDLLWRGAQQFEDRRWAVESARGLGRHLSQWLVNRGETVVDVPATATTRVRELSRGGKRKKDTLHAAAAPPGAGLHRRSLLGTPEDHAPVCALLEESRANPPPAPG